MDQHAISQRRPRPTPNTHRPPQTNKTKQAPGAAPHRVPAAPREALRGGRGGALQTLGGSSGSGGGGRHRWRGRRRGRRGGRRGACFRAAARRRAPPAARSRAARRGGGAARPRRRHRACPGARARGGGGARPRRRRVRRARAIERESRGAEGKLSSACCGGATVLCKKGATSAGG